MPHFSKISLKRLETTDEKLQKLFLTVVQTYDCTIVCGFRPKEEQEAAFKAGNSKLRWPNSKHNTYPSKAIDVVPYPKLWASTKQFYHFAGYVLKTAETLGIKVRWGGDWDSDKDLEDQSFMDLAHWELVE